MGDDRTRAVRFHALAVAQRAKANDRLDPATVAALVQHAERDLGADDPLTLRLRAFAEDYAQVRRRPIELAQLGHDLTDFIALMSGTEPPGLDRADIHG